MPDVRGVDSVFGIGVRAVLSDSHHTIADGGDMLRMVGDAEDRERNAGESGAWC